MNPNEVSPLVDSLRAVRRRWRVVLLLTVLVTGVALALSLSSESQYDATTDLLLQDQQPANSLLDAGASTASSDPERDLATNVELIKVGSTADTVRRQLNLPMTTEQLLDRISAQTSNNSNVVSIVVRDPNATRAAQIANAFADAYVRFRRDSARRRYTEAADLAARQLAGLSTTERDTTEARDLQARQRELEIAAALQTGGVEVVRRASVPAEPARPRPLLSAILGLLLGLVLGVVTALAMELFDRRLKDESAVEDFFGLPVLAAIPRPSRRNAPLNDPSGIEPYGLLAANLSLSAGYRDGEPPRSRRDTGRVSMITSPSAGDGKTSVTFGVAAAYARLGQRVIVIEADLRRPAFGRYMHLATSGGLAAVLAGDRQLEDELVWLDADAVPSPLAGDFADGLIGALPAGELPLNPQRALSQPAMKDVVKRARSLADVVLLDTAPVGTVNDATTILKLVHDVVLVVRLGQTTKEAARRALRVLSNVRSQLVGVVVTDAAASERYGYYTSTARGIDVPEAPGPITAQDRR